MKISNTVLEWKTDKFGRRYRELARGVIEYEPTIQIDGIEIPESELKEYNARKAEAKQASEDVEKNLPSQPRKGCPFSEGIITDCDYDRCALYLDGCTLARIGAAVTETAGRKCPFNNRVCATSCALYNDGCVLTSFTEHSHTS